MIVCDHSKVDVEEDGRRIGLSRKISGALGLFEGQTLFASYEEGSGQLFLSTVRLNPSVNYFRIYLEDIRGSLAKITEILKDNNINILSGGAFSMGNLWLSEFILDFNEAQATPDDIIDELEVLGGFMTSREITELFPRSFDLRSTLDISGDGPEDLHLIIPSDFSTGRGMSWESATHAVMSAWPRVKALFIDFYRPESSLVKISAKIRDVPGSLHALADVIRTQVNLQAIDELHHDAVSGVWVSFGILVMGDLDELCKKAIKLPSVLEFEVEHLS